MNTLNYLGLAGIVKKRRPLNEAKWLKDQGQPWTHYSVLDTITGGMNDTIAIILSAGIGDFCFSCEVQFDQIELTIIDSLPTSLDHAGDQYYYRVFPNPFSTQVTFESNATHAFDLRIYDNYGRITKEYFSISHSVEIDFTDGISGMYFYEIKSRERKISPVYGWLIKVNDP